MKNKKIPIFIGDIIVFLTLLALLFIIVYSYLNSQNKHYVIFVKDDISLAITNIIAMCLIPLVASLVIYYKLRKKYKSHLKFTTYDVVLYLCSIISICLLSIINFIFIFFNYYTSYAIEEMNIQIIPDKQILIYFVIVPLSILLILISVYLKVKMGKRNVAIDSFHYNICIFFNIINILLCYFFSIIIIIPLIIATLFYELIHLFL